MTSIAGDLIGVISLFATMYILLHIPLVMP